MALTISAARAAALILVVFGSAGCHTRSGEAIVLGKEYIPVAEVTASPVPEESPAAQSDEVEPGPEPAKDAPDLRGTAKDPRAVEHEQWTSMCRWWPICAAWMCASSNRAGRVCRKAIA